MRARRASTALSDWEVAERRAYMAVYYKARKMRAATGGADEKECK